MVNSCQELLTDPYFSRMINESGLIVATAIKDENGDGVFNTGSYPDFEGPDKWHVVLLVPIELYDDAINSPTVAWNGEMLNLAQVQTIPTVISQAFIKDNGMAWIDAHTDTGNPAPRMPRLVARAPIPGASNITYKWRLEVKYDRGNGSRTSRNQDEDTVKIPKTGLKSLGADQEWKIYDEQDWKDEISQKGFFGGTAKLYLQEPGVSQEHVVYTFQISGKNPEDQKARQFIESQADAGPNGKLWFAYAIAKSETSEYRGSFYNQFTSNKKSAWRDWPLGSPTWNDDGGTTPGGYGIFQVTGTSTSSTANIPRKQIWNWQDNIRGGLEVLRSKRTTAESWMTQQRNANNANGVSLPNHTVRSVTFSEGGPKKMEDAVTIKLYNGASRAPDSFTDNGSAPGFRLDPQGAGHYCFWRNASSKWSLNRYNNPPDTDPFNYVDRVCAEVEQ